MRTKSWTPTGVRTGGPHARQEEGRAGAGRARRRRDAGRRRRARRRVQDDGVEVVRGRLPRSYTGLPYGSGTMGGDTTDRRAERMSVKGLYDPPATGPLAGLDPAQVENLLLRAVLADLKAGGWDPASISNRSKCELGERLRLATGLPLRSITGFFEDIEELL